MKTELEARILDINVVDVQSIYKIYGYNLEEIEFLSFKGEND